MGLARAYRPREDNAQTVRARILFQGHIVQNFNRPDRIYCGWDEFTEDSLLPSPITRTTFANIQLQADSAMNSSQLNVR